ncbi:hypothetical protein KM043_012669 [Ampulex compressa]|nr:hypothetical protein KM043_012669 [Ampulex compressa]
MLDPSAILRAFVDEPRRWCSSVEAELATSGRSDCYLGGDTARLGVDVSFPSFVLFESGALRGHAATGVLGIATFARFLADSFAGRDRGTRILSLSGRRRGAQELDEVGG